MKKQNYFFLTIFLILAACGGQENKTINTEGEKTHNNLLVPPCLYPSYNSNK